MEPLFNKVTGLYTATLLKVLWYRCFLMNFATHFKTIKTPFLQNTSRRLALSCKEMFYQQIRKNPIKKEKNWKLLVRKTTTHAERNVNTTYLRYSYPFTIQKFLYPVYSFFLCFQWYIKSMYFQKQCNPIEDLSTIENYFSPSLGNLTLISATQEPLWKQTINAWNSKIVLKKKKVFHLL